MSLLIDIADALADSLADAELTVDATAPTVERKHWLQYSVEDLTDPVIAVLPVTVESVRASRESWQYDYGVAVYVGRHTPTEEAADAMATLAEDVLDLIRGHEWGQVQWPTGVTSPMTVEIEMNPDDALNERNVWRAVITATYRVHR